MNIVYLYRTRDTYGTVQRTDSVNRQGTATVEGHDGNLVIYYYIKFGRVVGGCLWWLIKDA